MSLDPRVTGELRYAQDAELPGMLHAALVRSPVPHARVLGVDASAVEDPDAVVLLPEDVAGLARYGCQIKDQTVLAGERVRFVGDIVAAVAAPTRAAARAAAQLVEVDYEELPAVFDPVEALADGAPLVHDGQVEVGHDPIHANLRPVAGTNVCHRFRLVQGDLEAGLAEADVVVSETYRIAGAQHAPMEPHATLARWEEGRLELWTGTQTPFNVRDDLAGMLGMDPEAIRVVAPPMGGSFGAKTFTRLEALAACLARKAGRPVKALLNRDEVFLTLNRHPAVVRITLGARADGTLLAKHVECWADTGAYADCGPGVATKMGYAGIGPYRIPHVRVRSDAVYTNLPPNGAYRGYGAMQSVWASERTMDLLAEGLGMSPLELRRRNVLADGDRFATGEVMHDTHFRELLDRAAAAVGYEDDPRGRGLCVLMKGMQTPSKAAIAVERAGVGYRIHCATAEMGQGARRSFALMAAEALGVVPEDIEVLDPDTDTSPWDTRTTSSRSTYMMGRALREAVRDLHASGGERGYGEVANPGGLDPDTGQGVASTHWHQGAGSARVSVDEETGLLCVEHVHTAVYAGRVVNRPGAELQNEGSMIMALGTTLFEGLEFAEGQLTNGNLSDYNLPSAADSLRITHELIERPGAEVHGLGETALPPVPPAIGNALHSLGLHLTDLPLTAERVLAAVDARGAGERSGEGEGAPGLAVADGAPADGRHSAVASHGAVPEPAPAR